ncbi:hypothetical protein DV515_00004344 [Chloebia gouldiae]|uniref:Uncharacterized protein n=1 Tax=Chloebia gouldiae TaxID=44316 RepID=A0A3L8SQE9_CHLGU|nr:hypothetical protein DV515_00004344 [Chloebia gouldiae]
MGPERAQCGLALEDKLSSVLGVIDTLLHDIDRNNISFTKGSALKISVHIMLKERQREVDSEFMEITSYNTKGLNVEEKINIEILQEALSELTLTSDGIGHNALMMSPVIFIIYISSQLAAGTCEIVTLDRDSSQPRRTIARQTARCACKKGQIAGTTRARPACVDVTSGISKSSLEEYEWMLKNKIIQFATRIIKTKQWCEMLPCLEGEGCDLLINKSGWTCTQPGGRIKTTTVESSTAHGTDACCACGCKESCSLRMQPCSHAAMQLLLMPRNASLCNFCSRKKKNEKTKLRNKSKQNPPKKTEETLCFVALSREQAYEEYCRNLITTELFAKTAQKQVLDQSSIKSGCKQLLLPLTIGDRMENLTVLLRIVLLAISTVSESFLSVWTACSFLPMSKTHSAASINDKCGASRTVEMRAGTIIPGLQRTINFESSERCHTQREAVAQPPVVPRHGNALGLQTLPMEALAQSRLRQGRQQTLGPEIESETSPAQLWPSEWCPSASPAAGFQHMEQSLQKATLQITNPLHSSSLPQLSPLSCRTVWIGPGAPLGQLGRPGPLPDLSQPRRGRDVGAGAGAVPALPSSSRTTGGFSAPLQLPGRHSTARAAAERQLQLRHYKKSLNGGKRRTTQQLNNLVWNGKNKTKKILVDERVKLKVSQRTLTIPPQLNQKGQENVGLCQCDTTHGLKSNSPMRNTSSSSPSLKINPFLSSKEHEQITYIKEQLMAKLRKLENKDPSQILKLVRLLSIGTSDKTGSLSYGDEIFLAPNLPLHQGKEILSAFVKIDAQTGMIQSDALLLYYNRYLAPGEVCYAASGPCASLGSPMPLTYDCHDPPNTSESSSKCFEFSIEAKEEAALPVSSHCLAPINAEVLNLETIQKNHHSLNSGRMKRTAVVSIFLENINYLKSLPCGPVSMLLNLDQFETELNSLHQKTEVLTIAKEIGTQIAKDQTDRIFWVYAVQSHTTKLAMSVLQHLLAEATYSFFPQCIMRFGGGVDCSQSYYYVREKKRNHMVLNLKRFEKGEVRDLGIGVGAGVQNKALRHKFKTKKGKKNSAYSKRKGEQREEPEGRTRSERAGTDGIWVDKLVDNCRTHYPTCTIPVVMLVITPGSTNKGIIARLRGQLLAASAVNSVSPERLEMEGSLENKVYA